MNTYTHCQLSEGNSRMVYFIAYIANMGLSPAFHSDLKGWSFFNAQAVKDWKLEELKYLTCYGKMTINRHICEKNDDHNRVQGEIAFRFTA